MVHVMGPLPALFSKLGVDLGPFGSNAKRCVEFDGVLLGCIIAGKCQNWGFLIWLEFQRYTYIRALCVLFLT